MIPKDAHLCAEAGLEIERGHNQRRRLLAAGAARSDSLGAVKLHLQLAPAHLQFSGGSVSTPNMTLRPTSVQSVQTFLSSLPLGLESR